MAEIISLSKKRKEKYVPATFIEMVTDPVKRKNAYRYYDEMYEETEEEKAIVKAWGKRRRKEDS